MEFAANSVAPPLLTDAFATLSRSISSRHSLQFLEALQLRKAVQTPIRSLENTLNPFTHEKGVAPGWVSLLLSFVVDIDRYTDALLLASRS